MRTLTLLLTTLFLAALLVPSFAHAAQVAVTGNPLLDEVLATMIYSAIGIVIAFASFKVVDLITPGDLSKDIAENNIALSILCGAMILGVCIIIASVLSS